MTVYTRVAALLIAAGSGLLPVVAHAQSARPAGSPWATYPAAGTCLAAVERIANSSRWSERLDTLRFDVSRTLPHPAIEAGKGCMRKFMTAGAASVATDQVQAMFLLARVTGQAELADSLFGRAMAQQRNRADSVELLWHAVSAWAIGLAPDLARSQAIAVRLDRLGVHGERPFWPPTDHWESQHDAPRHTAFALLDTAALRVELKAEEANFAGLPDTARHGAEGSAVHTASLDLLLTLLRDPRADSAVEAMAARAVAVLGGKQEEGRWGGAIKLMGKPFGPIVPDLWFNRSPTDSVMPRLGRVTLVQYVDPQHCFCGSFYTAARRLKQRFGDSLDLLILIRSHRHFGDYATLDPADEARLVSERLLKQEKLAATVAFWKTPYKRHPAPDRRVVEERVQALHDIQFGGGALVVDRRGKLMSAGIVQISPWGELALERLIESLLSAPAT